jgi:multidrug efflux pump
VALAVYQLPGTNAIETARRVKAKMEELSTRFPPWLDYSIVYDTTPFIQESIDEVFVTLRDAVILVAIVMLVFLQSWRAAIIPLAAVPVAIVGTFAAMSALGYSVNNLTLFGLVLAVGIVVDDAIVVVEAVQHYIEQGHPPREATARAMDAVAGPVVAVGLVLTAVFVPCVFISGIIGEFYRQFAVTIAVSTLLSAFNSLTLSPALCALLLKHQRPGEAAEPLPRVTFPLAGAGLAYWFLGAHMGAAHPELAALPDWAAPVIAAVAGGVAGFAVRVILNRALGYLFAGFNAGFEAVTKGYLALVGATLRVTLLLLVVYGGLLGLTYFAITTTPSGFIPPQDKGYLIVNVQLPDGASLGRTESEMRRLEALALRGMPGVKHTVSVSGQSALLNANAPNFGTLYIMLDDFPKRVAENLGADVIAARLRDHFTAAQSEATITVLGAPPIDGLGTAGGFKMIVEDPNASGATALERAGRSVVAAAGEESQVRDVFTGFRADTPWLYLNIDRDAANTMGVNVAEVINALQVFFGSLYVNDFNLFGRTWQVNVQADDKFRKKIADLKKVRVKSSRIEDENQMAAQQARAARRPMPTPRDTMVPIAGIISVKDSSGPVMVQRYNLYPAVAVNATPAPGVSSGQAIAAMERAAKSLPPTMRAEWTELALLQLQTQNTAVRAFVLSVVLVFLVLAAQYESWGLPLAVILVVPMCLLSAAAGVRWAGQDINIFTQVGFVVLVGLACKNAILIVEFAKQRADAGLSRYDAALAACKLRLRPIVMTSFAFVIGVVPLVLAEGAGAEMRRALGTAVFAGMLGVTLFGIFLTPVFFVTVRRVTEMWGRRARRAKLPEAAAPASAPGEAGEADLKVATEVAGE